MIGDNGRLTIHLEDLKIPDKLWDTCKPSELLQNYPNYYSTSVQDDLVYFGNQTVIQGFVKAYVQHRPITISPDIIWLLINQGFTYHVAKNSEKLRSMFVDFDGNKTLTVTRMNMLPQLTTPSDWMNMFDDFVQQIGSYVGQDLIQHLSSNFTTTTQVSLAASQISIMSAMKYYFKYRVLMGGCGIPFVNVEGTLEDWKNILEKLNFIKKYDLDWWVEKLEPIITEIINTKSGNINKEFWLRMIRYKDGTGLYNPSLIDGWICAFFPYLEDGSRTSLNSISQYDKLASEMISVPFNLIVYFPPENPETVEPIKCEILAGFVGMNQDPETMSVKPEIGWVVRKVEPPQTPTGFVKYVRYLS
ncbi:hypothetical protein TRFO_23703 [Tritrichomonas foetus]|uniref:DUF4419 domain-containing protein n=1 Tax=Tritrichomonas foetus TaxID=1144522 RepID=A0A1J4KAJ7_9EUKA|nr:hypothetical protein TRFO_23703 [Tritrichomonas foetus]|eukprot:OHT07994.1 hypothetical protein TRFO_23703 [Tritrichomonas foetus]